MVEFVVRPYFLQPYKVWPFLTGEKQKWPKDLTREYYLSFEDALWDLLPRLGYKKGSKFLVPSFYCVDVINNIRDHGYSVAEYPVNKDLSIGIDAVRSAIEKERPDIFVDFEAVGVATHISEAVSRKLPFHALIILDKVHTLVGVSVENYPISDRHLILTSTRKVSPFPGSLAVYTRHARTSQNRLPLGYTLKALLLWCYYISTLKFATFVNSGRIAIAAEKILKKHDDLVGDAKLSAPLSNLFFELIDRINISYIEETQAHQFEVYDTALHKYFEHTENAWTIPNVNSFKHKLRGYPIIIKAEFADKFLKVCRELGFLTVSQLDDCSWAREQKLFILPLGPHLNGKDIQRIVNIAQKALTSAIQYDTISA